MPEKKPVTTQELFTPQVQPRQARRRKALEFTHSSTRSTMIMLAATIAALFFANTPFLPAVQDIWESLYLGFSFDTATMHISLGHFINDFLMALFFLLVGLEIKFEMTAGDLTNPRQAILPIAAAFGGAIIPAIFYLAINGGTEFSHGWGVPMANDIAFCLGILAVLGSRVPLGLRAFLSTLTIVDDMIAICVIAIFYTANLKLTWLLGGILCFALLVFNNRRHVYELTSYLIIGFVMWICFYNSGVHATLAGVLLAFTIPAKSQANLRNVNRWFKEKARSAEERYDPGEPDIVQKEYLDEVGNIERVSRMSIPPITRLDHILHTPVYFFILPIFAFANAGIELIGTDLASIFTHPVTLGVFFGLLIGKPLGIFLTTFVITKLKISDLPAGVTWGHVLGVSVLGGVGFTMAMFVANLSFTDPSITIMAKAAIIAASTIAGILGFLLLRREANRLSDDEDDDGGSDVNGALANDSAAEGSSANIA